MCKENEELNEAERAKNEAERAKNEAEQPRIVKISYCHKAPADLQYFCHSSEQCTYEITTFKSAEDGITLSGCGKAGLKVRAEACAEYSDKEIEQKTVTIDQTVGAGKFICGVYVGQYDHDKEKWIYNFNNLFGEIDGEYNTCSKLIQKEIP